MVLFLPFFFISQGILTSPSLLLASVHPLCLCISREQDWGDLAIAWTSLRSSEKGAPNTLLAFALMLRKSQKGMGMCPEKFRPDPQAAVYCSTAAS